MKKIKLILFLYFALFPFIIEAAIPTGYYYVLKGKKKTELKSTLVEVSLPMYVLDYGSGEGFTWQGFYKTDRNSDNSVKDNYSNILRYFDGYKSISGMAIEHSFPKSWWGGYENTAYKDLFNLYPADSQTNSIKNNLPLGETSSNIIFDNGKTKIGKNSFGTEYSDNCFEPADEFKGDFARSYLYMVSIYESLAPLWNSPMLISNAAYPAWKPWAINLLLKWHRQDPVSQKEIDRNDSIYTIQNNRNPFIDHPELAEYIWGNDTTKNFDYAEETGTFLISPRRMTKLDFGITFLNSIKSQNVHLEGVNFVSSVTLSLAKQNSGFTLSRTNLSVAEISSGTDLLINFNPIIAGENKDTLLIQGGGLTETTRIPLKGTATSEFIVTDPTDVTPVGGTLNWVDDPQATDYKFSLYQGDTKAGDLIISGYYEGASNDKAIELFNGTGTSIDLSNYSLKKQTNGAGDYVVNYKLSGTLSQNQTYVIVYTYSTNNELRAKANDFADSICAFNGNDAVALFRNSVPVDIVGDLNGGADYSWGLDKILKRNVSITHPTMRFDLNEWTEFPYSNISKIGSHAMDLVTQSNYLLKDFSVGKVTSYTVSDLNPQQKYTYSVSAVRNGNLIPSINTKQLKTEDLEIPIALDATDVTSTQFTANWCESSYASSYLLDVFQLLGQQVTDTETFETIGTNGKPLPAGWSGTVSGNYTSTASSGQNPPSVGFKNNGEWLQTKQFPDTVNSLSFMYRFPSSGTGSWMKIEAQNKDGWYKIDSIAYVNTSKYYPVYNFLHTSGYTVFKFTYNKVGGNNFALDDVAVNHGNVDTIFVVKDKEIVGFSDPVGNISPDKTYYYRVRAKKGDSFSAYSDIKSVNTAATGLQNHSTSTYKVGTSSDKIIISNLKGNEEIHIYSITGSLLKSMNANQNTVSFPLNEKGIYIVQIGNKNGWEIHKVMK